MKRPVVILLSALAVVFAAATGFLVWRYAADAEQIEQTRAAVSSTNDDTREAVERKESTVSRRDAAKEREKNLTTTRDTLRTCVDAVKAYVADQNQPKFDVMSKACLTIT